jgi:PAS domain-containing protein
VTQPSPAPRFWPTAGPLGLAVIGLAVLTAISVRFAFRSALLYLFVVVFVSLTGHLAAAVGVSLVAFLCLVAFLSRSAFPGALLEPLNLVALLAFLTTSFVVTRLVSRWRTSFRELQVLQDRMGLVIDSIPAWASVILPDGAVEFVNRWGLEYTGLRFEDTLGSGWKIAVHPDDQASRARGAKRSRRVSRSRSRPASVGPTASIAGS